MWNFVGNEHAVELLNKSVTKGLVSHAYLFSGPSNVGKTTLAIKFAQFIECRNLLIDGPCGTCLSCWKISEGNHPDVQFIDVDSEKTISGNVSSIGIDDVRNIQRTFVLKPLEGKHRIFILREASLLSDAASNALLKWIEEPPPNVIFLLVTNNYFAIKSTIISRCQVVTFTHVAQDKIESTLAQFSNSDHQQRKELSKLSKGSIGWAIRASENPEIIEDYKNNIHIASALLENDLETRLKYAQSMDSMFKYNKEEAIKNLEILLSWWRDVMIVKNGLQDSVLNVFALDVLISHSSMMSNYQILMFIHKVSETIELLKSNVNSRLVLDSLVLSLPG